MSEEEKYYRFETLKLFGGKEEVSDEPKRERKRCMSCNSVRIRAFQLTNDYDEYWLVIKCLACGKEEEM